MPTITSTPVQISTTVPQYRQAGGTNFGELNPFIFKVGSNLFQLLAAVQTENRIGMFSRAVASQGGTWDDQPDGLDSANSPGIGVQSGKLNVFDDSANSGKIAVLYLETDLTSLRIVEFDTVALTWGTPTAAVTVENVSPNKFGFTRRSDGTYVVIGTRTGHLYYILNSGGVWGAITDTSLAVTARVLAGGLIDASDNSYVILNETGFAASLRHLDSTNTLSGAVQITTTLASANSAGPPTISFFGATGIAVGWVTTSGAAPAMVSIAPVATAPVFTDYTIYTPSGPFLNEFVSFVTVVTGISGALNVFLADVDNDQPLNQVLQSTFDGVNTWSAPTVFYDAITNPPPNGTPTANQQLIHTLNPIELAAGWVTPTAMETVNSSAPPNLWCTGFFLEQVSDISLACPLTNTGSVGTSFTADLIVSGGTPPYTFTLESGSLPPGLSLDPTTGVISGTPTTPGTYTYTVSVVGS